MESATSRIGDILGALDPGYLTLGLIRPALDLFRSETVAPNLSALMVIVAAGLLIGFWRLRVRPASVTLDERIAFLKQCRSPSAFYDRIDQFDALMMNAPFLAHGWSEFIEACLFTRREGKVNIEVSIRPGVFINIDDAEYAGLRIRWFHHVSGVFVGLGLLLTFIGLVAALYFSSTAINLVIDGSHGPSGVGQTAAIQKALAQLLNTATFKFLTSIAGLGCSLVLAWFQRDWTARLERKFQELCRELERCTIIVTPEQLANRQYQELTTQSELLRELPAQLGPEIARALEAAVVTALPAVLEQALAPVLDKLDETSRAVVNARQAPFQALAQEFSATVGASAGREMRAVAETLSGLPAQITAASETLTALPARMSTATDDLQRTLETLNRGLEAMRARIEPPPAREEPVRALTEELSRVLARIEGTIRDNANAFTTLIEGLRPTPAEEARTLAGDAAHAVAALGDAADRLGAGLDNALRQFQERSDRSAAEIAERFLDATEAARAAAGEQAARIEDAITKIAAAGREAGHGVEAAAETLDRRAREAAGQVTEGARQVLDGFTASAGRLWQQLDALGRAMAIVESRIAGHASALEGVNRAVRETETALEGSAHAVAAAAAPLARSGEVMARSTLALAGSVETTAETLKESQRQGQTLAADLRETLQRLQTVWSRHENRFADVDESLSRILTSIIDHVDAHGAALRDHVVKIDTHLAQTVNNLAGNVEALQETATDLIKAITIIQSVVEKMAQQTNAQGN